MRFALVHTQMLFLLFLSVALGLRSCTRANDGAIMNDVTTRDVYVCHGNQQKWVSRGPRLRPPRDLVPVADNVVLMRMCTISFDMQHVIGPHVCSAAKSGYLVACLEPRKRYVCQWDTQEGWIWKMETK